MLVRVVRDAVKEMEFDQAMLVSMARAGELAADCDVQTGLLKALPYRRLARLLPGMYLAARKLAEARKRGAFRALANEESAIMLNYRDTDMRELVHLCLPGRQGEMLAGELVKQAAWGTHHVIAGVHVQNLAGDPVGHLR